MTANLTAKFHAAVERAYGPLTDDNNWTPPTLSSSSTRHLETDSIALLNFITLSKLSSSSSSILPSVAEIAKLRAKLLIKHVHDALAIRDTNDYEGQALTGGIKSGTLLDGDASDGLWQSHRDLMYV